MTTLDTEHPVEAEIIEEAPSTEVARREVALTVTPQVGAQELVARLRTIREAMETAMTKDVDYGVIPGTGTKPTLLKPGAEKLSALFQLDVQLENEKMWDAPHLTVISRATVFHAPTGARLGYGEGICSTRERKYAYRQAQRVCPVCEKPAIIKGKAEYGGGWVCFKKKDGCGAKFNDDDPQIVSQEVGQVENPDLPDSWNTVVKMAEKRARVDAVLAVTGASALFTQDVEDQADVVAPAPPVAAQEPTRPVEAELVTPEDIAALQRTAKGLNAGQIKLAMGACGVPIPDPFVWNKVPAEKAAILAQKLAEIPRAK